ncbi:arsenic resistance protein [Fusibacter bizertensis]|uniref:Arsenic resistance protein n=1 Tax=Fusibacter bizertensis TaxID=1488331 RepID=A0ABT6NEE6_9FIRM|nr:arsenic resistance protein [Fusibacter bizertensis]MDH8678794.1 arsenic resistance protein [Fusibacter bizertensis]
MKSILYLPAKNLIISIPVVLILGFFVGSTLDTMFLKDYILFFTFFMIYPTMIGFKIKEAVDLSHLNVVIGSALLNFIIIPLFAFFFGKIFLSNSPQLFAGIIMISLFPTSGMTISWTLLNKGNVAAAIKITALSLIIGSFLAPLYLYIAVGTMIEVNIIDTFVTVSQIVILPLVLGNITYRLLLKKFTTTYFNTNIKPIFPAISVWSMMFIIFSSISMKAKSIINNPELLVNSILILIIFYLINFALSTMIGRYFYNKEDGYALVYGTVMRNLSIALGLAIASFGTDTALIITLAFILQVQGAAWYGKLSSKYNWLQRKVNVTQLEQNS